MQKPQPWDVELGVGIGRALYSLVQAPPPSLIFPLHQVHTDRVISRQSLGSCQRQQCYSQTCLLLCVHQIDHSPVLTTPPRSVVITSHQIQCCSITPIVCLCIMFLHATPSYLLFKYVAWLEHIKHPA